MRWQRFFVDAIRFLIDRPWESRAEEVRVAGIVSGLFTALSRLPDTEIPRDIEEAYHRARLICLDRERRIEEDDDNEEPEGFQNV